MRKTQRMAAKPSAEKHHDPECRSLAEHFLATEPPGALRESEVSELAQTIQNAIESWFDFREGPHSLCCPRCDKTVAEAEGVEGPRGNLWHQRCLDSWREDDAG